MIGSLIFWYWIGPYTLCCNCDPIIYNKSHHCIKLMYWIMHVILQIASTPLYVQQSRQYHMGNVHQNPHHALKWKSSAWFDSDDRSVPVVFCMRLASIVPSPIPFLVEVLCSRHFQQDFVHFPILVFKETHLSA